MLGSRVCETFHKPASSPHSTTHVSDRICSIIWIYYRVTCAIILMIARETAHILGAWGGKILKPPRCKLKIYLALLTAFLCRSASSITFRKYILKESDLHRNRYLISSVVMFWECSSTQAPTLIECEVNLSNSSFLVILCTCLAALWGRYWCGSRWCISHYFSSTCPWRLQ